MEFPRLPRFKRVSSVPPMELTERDRDIVRLIHRHRFLRSSHVISLIGGSSQQLLRRLQLLFHHGFLERPRAQLDYYHQGGSRYCIYGIGNKGAALLKNETKPVSRRVRWGEKNRSVGRVYLEHALLVSDIMVSIELACRESGRVRLLTNDHLFPTSEKQSTFRWKVNVSKSLKLGVMPDGVFALEFSDALRNPNRIHFFLEADRGTMPVLRKNLSQTSFYRKLLAYEATWSQGIHTSHFGFHRFRVLTVTKSGERVKSLVAACSELKRGQGLFLFTERTVLENPDLLFSPIWHTGRVGQTDRLLN